MQRFCRVDYSFIQQVFILEPFMLEVGQKLPGTCHLLFFFFAKYLFFLASSRKQASKNKRELITIFALNQFDSSKQSDGPFIRPVQVSQHSDRNARLDRTRQQAVG